MECSNWSKILVCPSHIVSPNLSQPQMGFFPAPNQTQPSYYWNLSQLQTITVICSDPFSENMPFLSGIFIGIGVPLIVSTMYDCCKKWLDKPEEIGS